MGSVPLGVGLGVTEGVILAEGGGVAEGIGSFTPTVNCVTAKNPLPETVKFKPVFVILM